ncbi:hypothetical protein Tco_0424762 [Tanacetum coccineum]
MENQWAFDDEPKAPEEVPQFPEQAPPSPNYVPGPEHPPSPDYVPGPEYLEYLVPSDDDEDPKEDHEEDPAKYPADGGDDDDDDDDDEEEEEDKDKDKEEEEHLVSADSTTLPAIDLVPSTEDTEAFETDESAPTPPSPRLRKVRISVRPQTPMAAATEALIAAVAAIPPSLSPPPSPLTPLSSPFPQIPSPPLPLPSPPLLLHAPSSPLLLPSTNRQEDIPEADVPPQNRLCLTAPAPRFEVGESSAAAAARQPRLDVTHATDYGFVDTVDATHRRPMSREVGYRITDVWDDMVRDMEERAPTTLEELSQRVIDLVVTLARDTHEMYVQFEDAQDDRAL